MDKLATTLTEMGHPISADTVCTELLKLGCSRQSNRTADEGSNHPDRNAQFEYINAKMVAAQDQKQPVISVVATKKELIGNFKNGGTDYRAKGDPQRVNVHDFADEKLGRVVPYVCQRWTGVVRDDAKGMNQHYNSADSGNSDATSKFTDLERANNVAIGRCR